MPAKSATVLILALILGACTPAAAPSAIPSVPARTVLPSATTEPSTPTPMPGRATAAVATATARQVRIAAVRGNLFIRRGPDLAFNPVAVLMDGQSETALARDVLSTWLQVPLPEDPSKSGWVSIQTKYSAVSGDIMSLPEVVPTEWPVLASLRNCTFHQMVAQPGGIVIPSLLNFPANDVPMNPGIYRIHDTDVDDAPEVLKVELREGSAIDVLVNGDGDKHKCPVP